MFSLLIVIAAIALTVALIVMMMYYGTDTLNKGRTEAQSAQAVNEVQQIKAAMVAYKATNGEDPPNLTVLAPKYLSSIPEGWGVDVPSLSAFEAQQIRGTSEAESLVICKQVNAKLGITGEVPACNTINSNFTGCCSESTS